MSKSKSERERKATLRSVKLINLILKINKTTKMTKMEFFFFFFFSSHTHTLALASIVDHSLSLFFIVYFYIYFFAIQFEKKFSGTHKERTILLCVCDIMSTFQPPRIIRSNVSLSLYLGTHDGWAKSKISSFAIFVEAFLETVLFCCCLSKVSYRYGGFISNIFILCQVWDSSQKYT